jgi:hypothetical protein
MDCFELWKQICANRILASTQFVLFLNKIDILEAKLEAGIKFSDFVTSYKGRQNDLTYVSHCKCDSPEGMLRLNGAGCRFEEEICGYSQAI